LPDDIRDCVEYVLSNTSPAIRQRKTLPTNRRYQILRMLIYAAQVAEGDIMRMNALLPDNVGYTTMEDAERIADELSASLQSA
jgi:predicted Co/Zn/Cd cation transporter (cation efflux family)